MGEYKGLQGHKIKVLSSDPSPVFEGQVWFNTTDNVLRVRGAGAGAWSESGDLSTARQMTSYNGSQTAGVCAGGGGSGTNDKSEEYNGTGWTEGNEIQNARTNICGLGGTGSQTASLVAGGGPPALDHTEEYNGTSWAETADLGTAAYGKGMNGTQTAGLCYGGYTPPTTANSEEYNGTGWTEGNNLNTARATLAGCGTQTAGLAALGGAPCEEYDGTSWSEVTEPNTAREKTGAGGIQTAAIYAGDTSSPYNAAEEYNGSTWATVAVINNARGEAAGGGTATAGLLCGGYTPGSAPNQKAFTEEYDIAAGTLDVTVS